MNSDHFTDPTLFLLSYLKLLWIHSCQHNQGCQLVPSMSFVDFVSLYKLRPFHKYLGMVLKLASSRKGFGDVFPLNILYNQNNSLTWFTKVFCNNLVSIYFSCPCLRLSFSTYLSIVLCPIMCVSGLILYFLYHKMYKIV